ncbi:type IV pilus modification protein PilV [Marinobacter halotolerans]|uniref:type IV pilus modification protein PilV n=1 Tax=Marinobacter halotolerans TaxID=1569211 RepID=UPI0012494AC5|nr:type IV pilus modification protein PilV [Marinobacter halotolerans]
MSKLHKAPGNQSGVTMIEVLVAVLILAIGLLGVAGLQSISLKNTSDVFFEQQAMSASADLINRIMANQAAASNGDYADAPPTTAPTTDCSSTTCSSEAMADWDLWQWSQTLTTGLGAPPSAAANVSWDAAKGEYEVAITWDANGAGSSYSAPTCTSADNTAAGCTFAVYRVME